MFYNRIFSRWVVDGIDCFLLSALAGSLAASWLKDYLSEKRAMERLKNSIIKKSKLVIKSDRTIFNSKSTKISQATKIKKIYLFALKNRGGEQEVDEESFQLAQKIKELVERLARFLKERELKGIVKIFFKGGSLVLKLILYKCNIDITYLVLTENLSTQVIVITATAGGAAGFTLSWFSAGASLVAPPLLISILLGRSIAQQIVNQRNYLKFKNLVNKMLKNDELKQTIRTVFMEGEVPTTPPSIKIKMKPLDLDKNSIPEFNFKSDQTFEEFLKARMKEELGLVENPTEKQLEEIIHHRKIQLKPKGKTVYYKDFIKDSTKGPDDIVDPEIVNKTIRLKVKNKEL